MRFLGIACACLFLCASAQAADRTDPSFDGGWVRTPVPEELDARGAPNIWNLAADGDGFVGALADLTDNQDSFGLVRYGKDGSLDTGFGAAGFTAPPEGRGLDTAQTQAVVVQPNGRVVAAGFRQDAFRYLPLLAGYRPDGSLDPSFGTGGLVAPKRTVGRGAEALHDLALRPDGGLIAVGAADEQPIDVSGRHPSGIVVAYTPDGHLDRSFGRNGRVFLRARGDEREYTGLRAVEVLPDGRILVAGFHYGSLFLARLRPNGRLDRSFGGGDGMAIRFLGSRRYGCFKTCWVASPFSLAPDGSIFVLAVTFPDVPVLLHLGPNGKLDRGFGRGGLVRVRVKGHEIQPFGLGLQSDRIVVTGWDEAAVKGKLELHFAVLRYLADGSRDLGFGNDGLVTRADEPFSGAYATLAQPGGRLLVAGGGEDRAEGDSAYSSSLLLTRYLPD
jgi:uncharacterized delta-60 repeat protein